MTRRAAATPDRIEATTPAGTGLVLPIAKALTHIMTIYTALTREWPLSATDAIAELEEAMGHMRNAHIPFDIMTEDASTAVSGWQDALHARLTTLRTALGAEDTLTAESPQVDDLKMLATDAWQLLTHLDRELTGLDASSADPGNLP